MLPRRRKPGAGPDPKCPTENHPRSLLFPIARSPPPPQTNIRLPLASRHPQSIGVTLFAGSTCRQGASDAMPSISTTHSALQIAVSRQIQFMLPSTCSAALGLQSSTLETDCLECGHRTLTTLTRSGTVQENRTGLSIAWQWQVPGDQLPHDSLQEHLVRPRPACLTVCPNPARSSQVPRPNDRRRASSARFLFMRYRQQTTQHSTAQGRLLCFCSSTQ